MGQIITIMPSEWMKLDLDTVVGQTYFGVSEIKRFETEGQYKDFGEALALKGFIGEEETINGVMLVNEDRELYIKIA